MIRKANLNSHERLKAYSQNEGFNFSQRSDIKQFHDLGRINTANLRLGGNEFKYKRFESFVFSGMTTTNTDRLNSSVFYYFPIL